MFFKPSFGALRKKLLESPCSHLRAIRVGFNLGWEIPAGPCFLGITGVAPTASIHVPSCSRDIPARELQDVAGKKPFTLLQGASKKVERDNFQRPGGTGYREWLHWEKGDSQKSPNGFPVDSMDPKLIPSRFQIDPQWIPQGFLMDSTDSQLILNELNKFPVDSQWIWNGFLMDSQWIEGVPSGFPADPQWIQFLPNGFPVDSANSQWIRN